MVTGRHCGQITHSGRQRVVKNGSHGQFARDLPSGCEAEAFGKLPKACGRGLSTETLLANCQKRFFGEDRHMQRMTITALARAEGVDKALMSRRVKKLKLEILPGARGAKLVAVASYLKAVGRPAHDELGPPGDQLDWLARKGKLGRGAEAFARLKAARAYQGLSLRAAGGDLKAAARIGEINRALGVDATERCRALLIEGRSLQSLADPDKFYLLRCFREHLDCVAENF
jgi:hypothetical protein